MLKGKNILCFGSENWDYPGFQQTIMRKLSASNRIIFVNPLGSRKIKLHYSQLYFYLRKIKKTFSKKYTPSTNTIVCSPWIIPIVYSDIIIKLNKKLIKYQFNKLLTTYNFKPYILWIGTPTASFLLDLFDPELLVYHAVDRYSKFSFVDHDKISLYEKTVAENANLILCTSDTIKNDLVNYNNSVFTVTHAVDFKHFYSALETDKVPEDIEHIPKPVIGYFGGLSERVNYSLIKKIADRYRQASIVLIGKEIQNLDEIRNISNIYILGRKSYEELPYYLNQFDVCLIPYLVNDLMLGVDPIKLREYLCQGKPVVSTNLPEARKLHPLVYLGEDEEDFVMKVGRALSENENGNIIRERRILKAKEANWPNKMIEISNIFNESYLAHKNPLSIRDATAKCL